MTVTVAQYHSLASRGLAMRDIVNGRYYAVVGGHTVEVKIAASGGVKS